MSNEEKIAILEQKIRILQMLYAAALADSALRYGKAGILDEIADQKRAEQIDAGAALAQRFGVKEPKQAFEKVQEIYGCASWVYEDKENGFRAACANCMLCALSKKMGPYSPCRIFCLSPIEAMIKSVDPDAEFTVEKTLWGGDECSVMVKEEAWEKISEKSGAR